MQAGVRRKVDANFRKLQPSMYLVNRRGPKFIGSSSLGGLMAAPLINRGLSARAPWNEGGNQHRCTKSGEYRLESLYGQELPPEELIIRGMADLESELRRRFERHQEQQRQAPVHQERVRAIP
jgi:hypothetical protein